MNGPLYHNVRRERESGTWGQGVTVPWSHQAVRVKRAKSSSWPTHSSQRATHSPFLASTAAREEHGTYFFHVQAHISCNCLSSYPHALCGSFTMHLCVLVALSRGPFLKHNVVLTFRPLISCDRCIPLGRIEFELFIKARESIRSRGAVGHKCVHAHFTPMWNFCRKGANINKKQSRTG